MKSVSREYLLESLQSKPLFEETFSKLYSLSDQKRVSRSKPMIVKYTGLYQDKSDGQAVTKWTVPSATNKSSSYTCLIGIAVKGGLFALSKEKWNAKVFSEAFANANVKVHCSCPDFYWSGMKYNLGNNGKLKGHTFAVSSGYKYEKDVVTKAPDKRDPNQRQVLCKHLLAIFPRFSANAFDIMRDAKKSSAGPVTTDIPVKTKKKDGAKKMIDSMSPQDVMQKTLSEGFVKEVINLHENGKLPDVDVDDIVAAPNENDTTKENIDVPELVNIDDVDLPKDVSVNDIMQTDNTNNTSPIETDVNDIVSDTTNASDNSEDEKKSEVDPNEIVGTVKNN